MPPGADAI
uniref:Uncharacterized protein n=1 Tax=Anguilla anguilla TaxID=7936 RepID=A0A0E9TRW1_ANGAN